MSSLSHIINFRYGGDENGYGIEIKGQDIESQYKVERLEHGKLEALFSRAI